MRVGLHNTGLSETSKGRSSRPIRPVHNRSVARIEAMIRRAIRSSEQATVEVTRPSFEAQQLRAQPREHSLIFGK
jgi:hypothetical protein